MERIAIITFWVLTFYSITSCNLFEDRGGPVDKISAFDWEDPHNFPGGNITFIHVTNKDELFVGTSGGWYASSDYGETFRYHANPDSVKFEIVKKFGDQYYAIGEYDIEISVFGTPTIVSSDGIFRSSTDDSWEQLLGPFWMYDILLDEHKYLYIAKHLGVSRLHIPTMEETIMEFMQEGSNPEFANSVTEGENGEIYVSTDRGLFRTKDQGENWEQLIRSGGSYFDDIEKVDVQKNEIIAVSIKELLRSEDNGESWNSDTLLIHGVNDYNRPQYYYQDVEFSSAGELLTTTSYGVAVGKPDSLSKLYIAGPEDYDLDNTFTYSLLELFSNGDVVVANGSHIMIGSRNMEADFWNDSF